jgi:beta-lactamase superfamily II metal-dependent hydrolase
MMISKINKTSSAQKFILFLLPFLLASSLSFAQLRIHHIDVGQGDSTLIIAPNGYTMLIDAGNNGKGKNVVLPYLRNLGISKLNYIVSSHYDADHIGGLDEVITGLGTANIGTCYDRGTSSALPNTVSYTSYASAARAAGRVTIFVGNIISMGSVKLKCVAVDGYVLNYGQVEHSSSSENDLSVALVLTYSKFKYFTGGDCGGETTYYADLETPMATIVGNVDAFKVNHHGSKYSSNQYFLSTIKSEVAFISLGKNSYGHATQATLNRISNTNKCKIYMTEKGSGGKIPSGKGWVAADNIVLTTTGKAYTISYKTITHSYPGD